MIQSETGGGTMPDTDFKFNLGGRIEPFARTVSGGGRSLDAKRAQDEDLAPGPTSEPSPPARPEREYAKSQEPRGLALKSLTLHKSKEGWIQRFFDSPNELVIVSSSFDLGGGDPFVYPAKVEDVNGFRSLRRGETAEWTFGEGFPVAPARTIIGSLVAGVQVTESDEQSLRVAEALIAAGKEVKSDGGIKSILEKLADPGKFAADQALKALTEITTLIGKVIESYQKKMDPVGLASGLFSAVSPWEGKLEQDLPAAKIVLVETR
jgi:hypothetical protein